MFVEITYGQGKEQIRVDESCKVLLPNKVEIDNENLTIETALKNPISSISFKEFVKKSDKLLLIVNDATRPTPTAKIIDILHPLLSNNTDFRIIVATGSHKPPSPEEYKFIFGKYYDLYKDKIEVHDAKKSSMKFYGKTPHGTEVAFNDVINKYRNIVTINSVEPHYFAGYTGGRKSFLPGLAAYKTIEENHKFAMDNQACALGLNSNPVNEDMMDSIRFLSEINVFSIQVVLTPDAKIYKVITGDLKKSFLKAVEFANEVFCASLKKKGNIVVTVAPPPMDINLYQSQKALENGKLALEENGIIILVSKCPGGLGQQAFIDLLCKADSPEEVLEFLKNEYKLGYHKAGKIAELATWADIWAVTDLDSTVLKKAFINSCNGIQEAVDEAIKTIKNRGKKPNLIIIPYGSLTVPFCQKR